MKIAICLFGQPRDYKHGYNCISNLMKLNSEHTYDFFFHCWIDDNVTYDCSPWRRINKNVLFIENQNVVKEELLEYYKPVSYVFEKPLDKANTNVINDMEYIKKSKMYSNGPKSIKDNTFNVFSQICTRSKVKDLFKEYVEKTNTIYDCVITTRFDGEGFPKEFRIPEINKNKIYVSSSSRPRYIILDFFLVIPPEIYIHLCNLYENIKHILDNEEIAVKMNSVNEKMMFNAEEYLLANYFFSGYSENNIEYIPMK